MTPQSSPRSLPTSPPHTEKKLPSRPTDFALVDPIKGTCSRDGKQVVALCLPGANQVIAQSWTPDEPVFMHTDLSGLRGTRLSCFNCDDIVVFVSQTVIMLARLRMENIFNGDIDEAHQLGKIAERSLDWTGPVDCFLLTPELTEAMSTSNEAGAVDPASHASIDAENHYISFIKRWGSRFRQRELERFFWSKWQMAKDINLTVVPYQPFQDPRVPQSSYVTILNEKAKEVLDIKQFVKLSKGDPFVSLPHDSKDTEEPPKLTTRIGGYGPWKQISIRSIHHEVSVLTIGCSGSQHTEGRTEYVTENGCTVERKFSIVYNA